MCLLAPQAVKKVNCGGTETLWRRPFVECSVNLLCQRLAKLDSPLVKTVHAPQEPAYHRHMLIKRQQPADGKGRAGLPADHARRTVSGKMAVRFGLVRAADGQRLGLGQRVRCQHPMACRPVTVQVQPGWAQRQQAVDLAGTRASAKSQESSEASAVAEHVTLIFAPPARLYYVGHTKAHLEERGFRCVQWLHKPDAHEMARLDLEGRGERRVMIVWYTTAFPTVS